MSNHPVWWAFCQAPQRDGSADDTDPLDGAGLTRWGWTFTTWSHARAQAGQIDLSPAAFLAMTQKDAGALAEIFFWNRFGGPQLPSGPDVSFVDFCWTSGGAVRVAQHHMGLPIDGIFGPKTLAALFALPDPVLLSQHIHDWRLDYYNELGFKTTEPGLYNRTDAILAVAKALIAGTPPDTRA